MPLWRTCLSRSLAVTCGRAVMASRSYWPIWQLTLSRLKEFIRQPAAVFWVYGFPILMMLSLGTAFRENQQEQIRVDVVKGSGFGVQGSEQQRSGNRGQASHAFDRQLSADSRFKVLAHPAEDWRKRLQAGKTDLVIEVDETGAYQLWDEPHRTESRLARFAVEAALLRSEQSQGADAPRSPPEVKHLEQAGSRYIDFLLPGMIGMGLMGGGLWGV